jgi:hypothetical protein
MEVSGQFHAPGRFTTRERAPDTHWIGVWVGPRAGLDAVKKIKIPSPCRDSNPQSSDGDNILKRLITKFWFTLSN